VFLADTSALHRSNHPDVVEEWARRLDRDQIATTAPVRLEFLYSARSAADYVQLSEDLDALHRLPCGEQAHQRAEQVQCLMAEQHALHHRSVKVVDLLIAAVGELSGATIWHYDEDYDRIAAVTGQATEWIAPRGSL
jgi:hypothetical protein